MPRATLVSLQVTAVGDLLGPTISGLERLLQIPTGAWARARKRFCKNRELAGIVLQRMYSDLFKFCLSCNHAYPHMNVDPDIHSVAGSGEQRQPNK